MTWHMKEDFKCLTCDKTANYEETRQTHLYQQNTNDIKLWSSFMIHKAVRKLMTLYRNTFSYVQTLPRLASYFPFFFLTLIYTLSHTHTGWVFDKPGNGAMEMLSRRTMQIRPYPQGDTVNGFNHQQNLHRGCLCVWVCAPVQGYQTQTCLQLVRNKLGNYKKKKREKKTNKVLETFETMSVLALDPSPSTNVSAGSGKRFFSHADPDFGNKTKNGCQTGIVIKILQ